jgi:hypothetical protein
VEIMSTWTAVPFDDTFRSLLGFWKDLRLNENNLDYIKQWASGETAH